MTTEFMALFVLLRPTRRTMFILEYARVLTYGPTDSAHLGHLWRMWWD